MSSDLVQFFITHKLLTSQGESNMEYILVFPSLCHFILYNNNFNSGHLGSQLKYIYIYIRIRFFFIKIDVHPGIDRQLNYYGRHRTVREFCFREICCPADKR